MAVELFTDGIEPADLNVEIWRFIEVWKFQDLVKTGKLYFRRSDLLPDESEGLPPEGYEQVLGLSRYDLNDIEERNNHVGFIAQMRQGFYINCWYLAGEETAQMWKTFAKDDGVAICSRYRLLKEVLDPIPDRPHLGLVRYGAKHLTGWNLMRFISTKREKHAVEKEVRAMLWILDPHEGGNRHIDINNRFRDRPVYDTPLAEGVWRPVDVQKLITEVIVSPYANPGTQTQVEQAMSDGGYSFPVRPSAMTPYARFLPTEEDMRRFT